MRRLFLIMLIFLVFPAQSLALGLIRDTEIEKTLKDYATPVWLAGGINPDSAKIYLINDPGINAFTAGGLNIFINTGLILKADNSNEIIGVLAHESGHIAGGHIIKRVDEAGSLNVQSILTTLAGAAVTVAGLPEAGIAVMAGGQHVAERSFMRFSREQEVVADQLALTYLKSTNQSANGLLQVLEILRRDQTLSYGQVDPYAISHPLSQERMAHIRSQTMDENISGDDKFAAQHARMVAKLYGFLEKPESTFMKYTDNSVPSRYARSIAYFRQNNFEKCFAELDGLIKEFGSDPFFIELKGQFLSESGNLQEAIAYYQQANQLYPNAPLIKFELGKIMLSENYVDDAIKVLNQAANLDTSSAETWRLLATAYGKKNNEALANLMLAEEANVLDKNAEARNFARLAKKGLEKNSPGWLRANDILADVKIKKKESE